MESTSRYAWPIRLALLGTLALAYFAPLITAMLVAVIGVPISFHYLIRWSRSKAKKAGLDDRKGPLQDLALIFATAPAVWLALVLDAKPGQEPPLAIAALWLWFQFAFLAPVLFVGRRLVLPGPNDSLKIGYFAIPWILMALFMAVGGRRQAWRAAYLDPQGRLGIGLIALAAVACLYSIVRLRAHFKHFPKGLFRRPAPRPDSRCRYLILGFVFSPVFWSLGFLALCLHWHVYLNDATSDTSPLAIRLMALHQALMEFTGLTLAFAFPLGVVLVWYALKYRMGSSPEPSAWVGVFLPWALLLLLIGIDPGGWFGWVFP